MFKNTNLPLMDVINDALANVTSRLNYENTPIKVNDESVTNTVGDTIMKEVGTNLTSKKKKK